MSAQPNTAHVSELRAMQHAPAHLPDQRVDMFSLRGFELAQRIARAFANSDAVPTQFRLQIEKKARGGSTWVDNPSALGNCVVAIEVAQAVGMSITAVMQQANIIEGKLSWSAQFVIAAINASGRFTPLRFQMRNLGRIKATYREKQGWNEQKRGFDFVEKTVEVENVECIAWALPKGLPVPPNIATLEQARNAQLPVIESAPVSMKMAVEEGWYSKPGSKWQTEMRTLMLQYRAGAFFGRIHAPDIIMGMGRTSEEVVDMTTIEVAPDGSVTRVTTDELRRAPDAPPPPPADVVEVVQKNELRAAADIAEQELERMVDETTGTKRDAPAFDADAFAERLEACKDVDALDVLGDEIRGLADAGTAEVLTSVYKRRREEMQQQPASTPAPSAPVSRRARPAQSSIE